MTMDKKTLEEIKKEIQEKIDNYKEIQNILEKINNVLPALDGRVLNIRIINILEIKIPGVAFSVYSKYNSHGIQFCTRGNNTPNGGCLADFGAAFKQDKKYIRIDGIEVAKLIKKQKLQLQENINKLESYLPIIDIKINQYEEAKKRLQELVRQFPGDVLEILYQYRIID